MGDKSTHNCILVAPKKKKVFNANVWILDMQTIEQTWSFAVVIIYLIIEVDFYKLPKTAAVIIPDCFCISKGFKKGIC